MFSLFACSFSRREGERERKERELTKFKRCCIKSLSFRVGVGKQSHRPNPTITCLCMAQKLKIIFTFVNGWKKSKEEKYLVTRKLYEIQMSMSIIKLYWNITCLTCLWGCFCAIMQWSSCNKDPLKPKIFTTWPFIKLC